MTLVLDIVTRLFTCNQPARDGESILNLYEADARQLLDVPTPLQSALKDPLLRDLCGDDGRKQRFISAVIASIDVLRHLPIAVPVRSGITSSLLLVSTYIWQKHLCSNERLGPGVQAAIKAITQAQNSIRNELLRVLPQFIHIAMHQTFVPRKRNTPLQQWVLSLLYLTQYPSSALRFAALQRLLLAHPYRYTQMLTLHNSFSVQQMLNLLLLDQTTTHPIPKGLTKAPPATLQPLLKALRTPSIEPQWIVQWCEQQPFYAQLLLASASNDNRQQRSVTNIKQAVLTYGIERVGDKLVCHTLQSQLIQPFFPIKHWCEGLLTLCVKVAELIRYQTSDRSMTPQSSELLVTLACSGLFVHPSMQTRMPESTTLPHCIHVFNKHPSDASIKIWRMSVLIAERWSPNSLLVEVIRSYNTPLKEISGRYKPPYCLLHLSLLWSLEWLVGDELRLAREEQDAMQVLGLGANDKQHMRMQLQSLLVAPLLRKSDE